MLPRFSRGPAFRPLSTVVAAALLAGTLASCSTAATSTSTAVAGTCPSTIVSQLSWFPDPTHAAFITPLLDPRFALDKENDTLAIANDSKTITGKIRVPGIEEPVTWAVQAGGPAKGGAAVSDLMYTDKTITLGQQATEEQVAATARDRDTLSVLAPLDGDPVGYAWDPTVFPDFNTLADVGQTDTPVLAYRAPSVDYLLGEGTLRASQIRYDFDGSPAQFLARKGRMVVAGFGTGLPYDYAHLAPYAANRKMEFAYLGNQGWPAYRNLVTIRKDDRAALDWCLRRIVPVMQQAQADFMASPDATLKLIERVNTDWRNPEPWSFAKGRYAWQTMGDRDLVSNGPDGFGVVDLRPDGNGRVSKALNILIPNFLGQKVDVPTGLSPGDLATNEYVDRSIRLPAGS